MERKDTIQNAYRLTGSNNFYDGMITCSTASGKAVCRAVWGMNKAECDEYLPHVLSLNGFHAFPGKEAAYKETFRVLKLGGTFCGCFYVKGGFTRTDWFIKHLYQPMKFFTSPYETMESLKARLGAMYGTVEISNVKGIAWFVCRKNLPETITVREKLLPENGNISQIPMSAMENWGGGIKETATPASVIIEGRKG